MSTSELPPAQGSPRSLLWSIGLGLLPSLVFFVLCAALSATTLELLEGEVQAMMRELRDGGLTAERIEQFGTGLRRSWLGMFAALVVMTAATVVLVRAGYRQVKGRLRAVDAYIAGRVRNEDPVALPGGRGCALGELEERVMRAAADMRAHGFEIARKGEAQRFEAALQRALELVDDEGEIIEVARLALEIATGPSDGELLLADSSQANLRRVIATDNHSGGCPVRSLKACAAVRRGQTLTFHSSEDLDACPRLREHPQAPCAAVCTPVSVMGRTIGVIHVTSPVGEPLRREAADGIETVATQVGARLGMVRTLAASDVAASTDPLTGLLNRRSFEAEVAGILGDGRSHCIVLADLDHFKRLNDSFGHAAGDRALCLFARVLKDHVRSNDRVGRYGGEEFVILLYDCKLEQAKGALERLRTTLMAEIGNAGVPPFTFSMGLARAGVDGTELAGLIAVADGALYEAKSRGRDRVVVAGTGEDRELVGPRLVAGAAEASVA